MSHPYTDLNATINRVQQAPGVFSIDVALLFAGEKKVEVFQVPYAQRSHDFDPIAKLYRDIQTCTVGREQKLLGYHVLARDGAGNQLFHNDSDPPIPEEFHGEAVLAGDQAQQSPEDPGSITNDEYVSDPSTGFAGEKVGQKDE